MSLEHLGCYINEFARWHKNFLPSTIDRMADTVKTMAGECLACQDGAA